MILPALLSLATSALLSCSSSSVPSWALATSKKQYRGASDLVERSRPKETVVARPSVGDAEADDRKVIKVDNPEFTGSAPRRDDHLNPTWIDA